MIKRSFIVTIIFSIIYFFPLSVYAHFPRTDKSMTVTLHVDPNDDPIPGQQATLYFLFSDATKKFQLRNCTCAVSISEQGKQIYQQMPIEKRYTHPSIWGTSIPYIFPKRDVYHIMLTGTPVHPNDFQPFTLSWDFRVDQYPITSPFDDVSGMVKIFLYIIGGIIGLSLLAYGITALVEKKKEK